MESTSKYALIYEFNNESPLFARVAGRYIEEKDYEQAIRILEKGLSEYPEYPTAYYIYSVALAHLGEKSRAYEMAKKAADLHGTTESMKYYTGMIEDIAGAVTGMDSPENVAEEVEQDSSVSTIDEKVEDNKIIDNAEQEVTIDEEIDLIPETEIKEETKQEVDDDTDDELKLLADKLKNAVMPSLNDTDNISVEKPLDNDTQFSGKSLVSETLAKIHLNQGNYSQALSIYETLIDIQPEKKEYYQGMIDQIKEKL